MGWWSKSDDKNAPLNNEGGVWLNNLDDLTFALGVCIFTFAIGSLLRKLISHRGFGMRDNTKRILYEVIGSAEQAVASFELVYIVYGNYSIYIYLIGVFAYSMYATSGDPVFHTVSNPSDIIFMYLTNEIRFEMAIITILAQVGGALLPYFLIIKPAWTHAGWWCIWKDQNIHTATILEPSWKTAVNPTNPMISALSEGLLTCLMYLTARSFNDIEDHEVQRTLTIFSNTLLGGIGPQYSGGFYNPAMATGLEIFITSGVNLGTKIWVYWVSPILGTVAALLLENVIFPPHP